MVLLTLLYYKRDSHFMGNLVGGTSIFVVILWGFGGMVAV
jgi:hypothetical protein